MLPVSKNAVIDVKHFNILTQNLGNHQLPSTPLKHICQFVCENSKDLTGEKEVQK